MPARQQARIAGRGGDGPILRSELPDERDLRLQLLSGPLPDDLLDPRDQGPDVRGGRSSAIHDDVGMAGADDRASDPGPLQSALVDQPPGPYPLDFLEDGPGARLRVERRVALGPPGEVLAH